MFTVAMPEIAFAIARPAVLFEEDVGYFPGIRPALLQGEAPAEVAGDIPDKVGRGSPVHGDVDDAEFPVERCQAEADRADNLAGLAGVGLCRPVCEN